MTPARSQKPHPFLSLSDLPKPGNTPKTGRLTKPVDRNTPSTFADFPLQRHHGPRCPGNEATALKVQVRPFFLGGGWWVFSIRLYIVLGKCLYNLDTKIQIPEKTVLVMVQA